MSRRWLAERRRDIYHRMAKGAGYRSRAAFKLKQLDERYGFLRGARYVLDLGAAPGGWLQVAAEAVGEAGRVVGVDLEPVEPLGLRNVRTIVGDVGEAATMVRIRELFPGQVDVVLSDMAPDISGIWELDQLRQIDLSRAALAIAKEVLRAEGWAVLKVFQGPEYEKFLGEAREAFLSVKVAKPKASRKGSAETYLVARGLRASGGVRPT